MVNLQSQLRADNNVPWTKEGKPGADQLKRKGANLNGRSRGFVQSREVPFISSVESVGPKKKKKKNSTEKNKRSYSWTRNINYRNIRERHTGVILPGIVHFHPAPPPALSMVQREVPKKKARFGRTEKEREREKGRGSGVENRYFSRHVYRFHYVHVSPGTVTDAIRWNFYAFTGSRKPVGSRWWC